jgi:hypothetical protein
MEETMLQTLLNQLKGFEPAAAQFHGALHVYPLLAHGTVGHDYISLRQRWNLA